MKLVTIALVILLISGVESTPAVLADKAKLIEVGPGRFCKWSPDGRYLSFANKNGLQLYVVDSGTVRTIAPRTEIDDLNDFTYQWASPSELLFTRRREVKTDQFRGFHWDYLSIGTNGTIDVIYSETVDFQTRLRSRPRTLNTGQVTIARESPGCPEPLKHRRELSSLSADAYFVVEGYFTAYWGTGDLSGLWLVRPDGTPYKKVACEWDCRLPLLSPNGQYIMCRIGRVIIDTSGTVVGLFDYGLDFEDWFTDGKRVLYTRPLQSEYDVIGSDIYVSDMDASNAVQLTDTPDKIELDPTVSPDMTKIAYRNYASNGNFIEILDFGEVIR
jgi:dipeptidyl aminopeptidase/acylaminoacyl peptidase